MTENLPTLLLGAVTHIHMQGKRESEKKKKMHHKILTARNPNTGFTLLF